MTEVMAMPTVLQVILQMVRTVMGIPKVIQAVREMVVSYVIATCFITNIPELVWVSEPVGEGESEFCVTSYITTLASQIGD